MSRPLKRGAATPWQVVPDTAFKLRLQTKLEAMTGWELMTGRFSENSEKRTMDSF